MTAAIHCRSCGYNLYGLPAGGACPECGLETWETILHTVDPASSRLPRLRDPVGVGNALLALVISLLLGALALASRPAVAWLDRTQTGSSHAWLQWLAGVAPIIATVAACAALLAVRRMAQPPAQEPAHRVQRDFRLTAGGLLGAGLLLAALGLVEKLARGAPPELIGTLYLLLAAPAVIGLGGLGGILDAIGRRSRAYRTARGGRQGVQAMIAAVVCLALGRALEISPVNWWLKVMGSTVSSIGALMLLIGLAYLVVNVSWIRRSLRRPPPRVEEILAAS